MSALQGLITYPGLTTFKSAEYTASHGIAPGACTIELPQELVDELAPVGDLTFSYGDGYVTLFSCAVDLGNTERGGGGYISRVQIYDRRRAWKFGAISGHYNLPAPGIPTSGGVDLGYGSQQSLVRADTQQTAQQLAVLCLQAMGESLYDVSALPNNVMPETHWSYENPAEALEQLCESLGCRVVLDLDSNGVRVVVIGEGADLPEGPIQWVSASVAPQQAPSSLLFVGGQTVQQGFIPLMAVGRDASGAIVPINLLSYTPGNTWAYEPIQFPSLRTEPNHTYAEESVYRWWQPSIPFTAPDGSVVSDLKQLILFDRQLDSNLNPRDPNGATTQRPEILGFFDHCYAQTNTSNYASPLVYHGAITVDQNRYLVITGDPLVNKQSGANLPATLWLKTSFSLRDPTTREPKRYTQSLPLDGAANVTQPQIVRHDEIVLQVRGAFSASGSGGGGSDNSALVSQAANYYLQAVAQQFEPVQSLDVPYVGIVPIQVDGAIQQVTYSIHSGEGGSCLTRASRNTEHSHYIPKYERRRDKAANQATRDRSQTQKSVLTQLQQNTGQAFVMG